jgi:phage/plasmid-associated DNA primase
MTTTEHNPETFLPSVLSRILKTPFYSAFIDETGDIKPQKEKMTTEICEIAKKFTTSYDEVDKKGKKTIIYNKPTEEEKEASIQYSKKQYHEMDCINAIIYKIPHNIVIVDTDDEISEFRVRRILNRIYGEEMVNKWALPSISRALGVNMNKGYHYYFVRDENLKFTQQRKGIKNETIGNMDILGEGSPVSGWAIEYISSPLPINTEQRMMSMNNELFEELTGEKMRRDSERSEKDTDTEYNDELEEKFRNIEVWRKYCELLPNETEERDDWLSLARFFKKFFDDDGYDIFQIWSEKWSGHNEHRDMTMWRSLKTISSKTTVGTPIKFMKDWAPESLKIWLKFVDEKAGLKPKATPLTKKPEMSKNEPSPFYIDMDTIKGGIYDMAEHMKHEIRKRAVYCLDSWYIFNDETKLWMTGKVQPTTIIAQTVKKFFLSSISQISSGEVSVNMKEEEAIKFYIEQKKKIDTPSATSQFTAHLRTLVLDNEFKDKLNQTRGKVVYKNGIYDIETNTLRAGIFYDDFLTFTLPFNYIEPTPEDKQRVEEILMKTNSQDREKYEYYIKMLGYSMTGYADREQCAFFCNGMSAGNGKSLIFESLSARMVGYVKKLQTDCFERDNSKRHKQFNDIDSMRILWVNEVSQKQQDVSFIKDISDGVPFKNEVMYGTEKEITVQAKVFFVSNGEPKFASDEGIRRRYRYVEFCSKFFDDGFQMMAYTRGKPEINIHYIRDKNAPDFLKSDEGMSALLSIIYDGARLYLRDGLKPPARYEELKETAIRANNNYADFIDNFRECQGKHIHKDELAQYWECVGIKSKFNLADCIQAFREKGYVYDGNKQKKINKKVKCGFLLNMEFIEEADSEDE